MSPQPAAHNRQGLLPSFVLDEEKEDQAVKELLFPWLISAIITKQLTKSYHNAVGLVNRPNINSTIISTSCQEPA